MMGKDSVHVVRLDYEGQVCIWDNIEAALEEIRLFWSEGEAEVEEELKVTLGSMPKADYDALPEFAGW